jgi:hypothetical protein
MIGSLGLWDIVMLPTRQRGCLLQQPAHVLRSGTLLPGPGDFHFLLRIFHPHTWGRLHDDWRSCGPLRRVRLVPGGKRGSPSFVHSLCMQNRVIWCAPLAAVDNKPGSWLQSAGLGESGGAAWLGTRSGGKGRLAGVPLCCTLSD